MAGENAVVEAVPPGPTQKEIFDAVDKALSESLPKAGQTMEMCVAELRAALDLRRGTDQSLARERDLMQEQRDAAEERVRELENLTGKLRLALEPFARVADACDESPAEMPVLRGEFEYNTRSLGRDNDEIVETHTVRVADLRAARTVYTDALSIGGDLG